MKQLLCNDSTGHIKDTTNKCANLGEETPVYLGLHEDAYFVLEP